MQSVLTAETLAVQACMLYGTIVHLYRFYELLATADGIRSGTVVNGGREIKMGVACDLHNEQRRIIS